ncbi:RHS repeat-associated core domain-containing protein [Sorangium sp. So ce429]
MVLRAGERASSGARDARRRSAGKDALPAPRQLGSVDVITDASGGEHGRRSYNAWGARCHLTWEGGTPGSFEESPVTQGFTGHEGDDELGLINMRGRMYDPVIGRFLTRDPLVANHLSGHSLNPYSYVLNNPLAYVDP